jgi:hypothetical protein
MSTPSDGTNDYNAQLEIFFLKNLAYARRLNLCRLEDSMVALRTQ